MVANSKIFYRKSMIQMLSATSQTEDLNRIEVVSQHFGICLSREFMNSPFFWYLKAVLELNNVQLVLFHFAGWISFRRLSSWPLSLASCLLSIILSSSYAMMETNSRQIEIVRMEEAMKRTIAGHLYPKSWISDRGWLLKWSLWLQSVSIIQCCLPLVFNNYL